MNDEDFHVFTGSTGPENQFQKGSLQRVECKSHGCSNHPHFMYYTLTPCARLLTRFCVHVNVTHVKYSSSTMPFIPEELRG